MAVRGRWSRIFVEDCDTSPFSRCGTQRASNVLPRDDDTASILMCFLPDSPLFAKVVQMVLTVLTDIECTS